MAFLLIEESNGGKKNSGACTCDYTGQGQSISYFTSLEYTCHLITDCHIVQYYWLLINWNNCFKSLMTDWLCTSGLAINQKS